jgi:hypothetical protein
MSKTMAVGFPKFFEGQKLQHAITRNMCTVLEVKPGHLINSYIVRDKRGFPYNASEGELHFPIVKEEKKRSRYIEDEEEEKN